MQKVADVTEIITNRLGYDGWYTLHLLSHVPVDADALRLRAPEAARGYAVVKTWEDEVRMYHAEVRWPMRGLVRWVVRSRGAQKDLWQRLMVLWWIGKGGRISTAALAAANAYQRATGDAGIFGWVRRMPSGMSEGGDVALPGGDILVVGEAYWVPRGFVAVSGKEARWTRYGNAPTGTS